MLNGAGFWPRGLGKLAVPTKFCVVGAMNALVDFGTLNLLSWSWPAADAVQLALYNTLALVLANANSYLFNTLWTFKEQTRHEGPRQRATFVAQAVLNVGVNNGLFWLTAGLLADTALSVAVAQNVAKAISTVAASTLSFLLMRYVVFSSRRGTQRSVEGAHVTSTGRVEAHPLLPHAETHRGDGEEPKRVPSALRGCANRLRRKRHRKTELGRRRAERSVRRPWKPFPDVRRTG